MICDHCTQLLGEDDQGQSTDHTVLCEECCAKFICRARETQAARMRNPGYVPTIEEALADPAGFMMGMTQTDLNDPRR